jgi:dipeptidyl aminopeptidase/acylaminoacyl peptidase
LRKILLCICVCAGFFLQTSVPDAAEDQDPAALFGANAGYGDASLSPGGKYLAMVLPVDEGDKLAVLRMDSADNRPVVLGFPGLVVHAVDWDAEERIVARVHRKKNDKTPSAYWENALWAISFAPDGSQRVELRQHNDNWAITNVNDRIDDLALDDPGNIYMPGYAYRRQMGVLGTAGAYEYHLFRVSLENGAGTRIQSGTERTARWIMDGHGHVVARIDTTNEWRGDDIFAASGDDFRHIAKLNDRPDNRGSIAGLTEDGRSLAVLARRGSNHTGLYRLDLADGAWGEALFAPPMADVAAVLRDERTQRVVGASYVDGVVKHVYFSPERQRLQTRLEEVLPGRIVRLVSSTTDGTKHIVEATGLQHPPTLHLVDLSANRVDTLRDAYPQLDRAGLADLRAVTYTTEDGIRLTGMMLSPPQRAERGLPLIVLPSMAFDNFDPVAHFLVRRGYAVLIPGTRDERSFGDVESVGQLGEWSMARQADIRGGIAELVRGGIVDPARVCMLGSNGDGYVALVSSVLSPEYYKCIVSITGLSDLKPLLKSARAGAKFPPFIYNVALIRNSRQYTDEEVERFSPFYHANDARAAFLLIDAEDNGWRNQSATMAAVLKSAGKSATYVEFKQENGMFETAPNRTRMLTEIDRFLAQQLRP